MGRALTGMLFTLALLSRLPLAAHAETAAPPAPALPAQGCAGGVSVAAGPTNARLCLKPGSGEAFRDCPECPEMVAIPAGRFAMGTADSEIAGLAKLMNTDKQHWEYYFRPEGPRHEVRIAQPFAASRFAVTRDEFEAFVKDTGYEIDDCGPRRGLPAPGPILRAFAPTGLHPVVCVSWQDAKAYAAWLAKKTGKGYRLPAEAEWEHAARAGTGTPYWWGASISAEQANYDASQSFVWSKTGEFRARTVAVNSFAPNPWGLYQVHGNVSQWVEDCLHNTYKDAPTDGSAWMDAYCSMHVARGGSYIDGAWSVRAAARRGLSSRGSTGGFRVARNLD